MTTRCGACSFTDECAKRHIAPPVQTDCGWFVPAPKPDTVTNREDEHPMGRASAEDMITQVDRRTALNWHLQYNHYPPIPPMMIDACLAAIEAANLGEWDQEVELPEGVTYRDYGESCPASALIEHAHLHSFIDEDGE